MATLCHYSQSSGYTWSQFSQQKLKFLSKVKRGSPFKVIYRTRAIIGRSRFEAALDYKPRILGLKNEDFLFLVHKLSVI